MGKGLGAFVRRRPLLSFYGLAIAFPVILFTYMIVMELVLHDPSWPGGSQVAHFYATKAAIQAEYPLLTHHGDSVIVSLMSYWAVPRAAPFLFFPFAPTVAALVIVWLGWRGEGLRALLGAYRPVRGDIGWRRATALYLTLGAFVIAACAISLLVLHLQGDVAGRENFIEKMGFFDARFVLVTFATALLLNQGGLLEELGWRGYALPLLMDRLRSPLAAALFLGLIWALWHFPREIPSLLQGGQDLATLATSQAVFIAGCCAGTIVFTSFVNLSGGSVLPAIVLHGLFNLLYSAFETTQPMIRSDLVSPAIWAWVIAAGLCLLALGPDLGLGARRAAHGGDGSTDPSRIWTSRT